MYLRKSSATQTNFIGYRTLGLTMLCSEESPNDFDKNHKFKVDAHLVM